MQLPSTGPIVSCLGRRSAAVLAALLFLGQAQAEASADEAAEAPTTGSQISARTTAAVRDSIPAFVPPVAISQEPRTETPEAVVLDKFTIFGAKTRHFSELELLTPIGRAAYLRKRYPGAGAVAGLMLEEDLRLENMARLQRVVENLEKAGDLAGSKALQKEINRTFMRRTDWRSEALDHQFNRGRR